MTATKVCVSSNSSRTRRSWTNISISHNSSPKCSKFNIAANKRVGPLTTSRAWAYVSSTVRSQASCASISSIWTPTQASLRASPKAASCKHSRLSVIWMAASKIYSMKQSMVKLLSLSLLKEFSRLHQTQRWSKNQNHKKSQIMRRRNYLIMKNLNNYN